MISILVPLLYIFALVGSLWTFSYAYRKRKIQKAAQLKPWFETHTTRDLYISLMKMEAPADVLRAALIRRAAIDVGRIMKLRQSRPALQQLLQRGLIGDELWTQFLAAERDMDIEVKDVVNEANKYKENWGQQLFATAGELAMNEAIRKRIKEIQTIN